ncbi:SAVMC3_10250 family protein [Micromonospora noduli]
MRDFVYVSTRKVSQIQFGNERRRWWSRISSLGFKAPLGLGELTFSLADGAEASRPKLAEAIKLVERANRPITSYQNESLESGQWVSFDARLSFKCRTWRDRNDQARAALLFWQPAPLESGTTTRILLHGSPAHLVGAAAAPDREFGFSYGPNFAEWLSRVSEGIARDDDSYTRNDQGDVRRDHADVEKYAGQVLRDLDGGPPTQRAGNDSHALQLKRSEAADRFIDQLAVRMAQKMVGLAQVTTVLELDTRFDQGRLVIASPLYVERANQGQQSRRRSTP